MSHLSSHELRAIALQAATESVGQMDRSSLLALVHIVVRAESGVIWNVQHGKVHTCLYVA